MIKPKLKDLQEFTKYYFKKNCPTVRWKRNLAVKEGKKKVSYSGLADIKKNIIYLNPGISISSLRGEGPDGKNDWFVLDLIEGWVSFQEGKKMKLKDKEQYFLVLLHEIAEFKIQKKAPKYFKSIKERAIKEIKKSRELRDKTWGKNKSKKRITLDDIVTEVDYNSSLNRRLFTKGKWDEGEWSDFRSWLGGRLDSEHIAVEKWAIKEFEKQRKKIREILKPQ